jgi:fructan beta-fructosidase
MPSSPSDGGRSVPACQPDDERLRPRHHYTAPAQWMNDPNGLVFVDGEYHLFFQTNPNGSDWGDISWGHAVSPDLVSWTTVELALRPYPGRQPGSTTLIFSGSAVVVPDPSDPDSGMDQQRGLSAYFTAHERRGEVPLNESVALARSTDGGRTWLHHPGNPVLDAGRVDFRDPKVFWHQPTGTWVLALADASVRAVRLYRSADGMKWEATSSFQDPTEGSWLWECPDLFPVAVRGTEDTRWVLVVSGAHPAGAPYTGMTYWVGHFDGHRFQPDPGGPRPVEHGKDFFAAVTYNGLAATADPVMVGWAANWAYARFTPTPRWRGAMALPRRLWLDDLEGRLVLAQAPVRQFDALVETIEPVADVDLDAGYLGADIRFRAAAGDGPCSIRLVVGPEEWVEIGIDVAARQVWVDRRQAGGAGCHRRFPSLDLAPLALAAGADATDVRVIVDHSIVEIFTAAGRTVLTELVYPSAPWRLVPSPGLAITLRPLP